MIHQNLKMLVSNRLEIAYAREQMRKYRQEAWNINIRSQLH